MPTEEMRIEDGNYLFLLGNFNECTKKTTPSAMPDANAQVSSLGKS